MHKHPLRRSIAGAAVAAGAVALTGGGAFAATARPHASFGSSQQALEQQLATRAIQLSRLAADVSGSKTVDPAHASVLSARIGTEQTNINALIAKVPTDTTHAQLNADRAAMLKDNRVFAVMTPQVFETISADAAIAELTVLQSDESQLAAEVASIVGQPGYKTALSHDQNFVQRVANQTASLNALVTQILAQQPSNWPHDQSFFVRGNRQIRDAGVAIAYADYDASVIALATGGYTGS